MDMRKLFKCANVWTKELVEKYKDVDYKTQFGLCVKELIRQKKANEHHLF